MQACLNSLLYRHKHFDRMGTGQEGGAVSRVNIGSLITASVTSRHTSVIFKMEGKFLVRYVAKDVNFLNVWIHLLPSSIRQSF